MKFMTKNRMISMHATMAEVKHVSAFINWCSETVPSMVSTR